MESRKYSVVIRNKNEIRDLPATLLSLRTQCEPPTEVILVDDSSDDGSQELASAEGAIVIKYDLARFNYSRALNLGVRAANCSFVLLLSAHCPLINPSSVSFLLDEFHDPEVAGAFGRQLPTINSSAVDTRDLLTVFPRERIVYHTYPFFHNAFSLIRKADWEATPFDESVNGIEDRIWASAKARMGKKIVYQPSATCFHEHGLNQGFDEVRAKRVCGALRVLHQDDIFDWPVM